MKKILSVLLLAAAATLPLSAEGIKTAGDGTTYTLESLAAMPNSGVEKSVDGITGLVTYRMLASDTISEGDKFVMDDGVKLLFDHQVILLVRGEADFDLEKGSIFNSTSESDESVKPIGVRIENELSQTVMRNCSFCHVGVRCASTKGMTVDACEFSDNNGAIGQGALTLGTDGAPFEITNSHFRFNSKAAIAGAANYRNPLLIENCVFTANGQANGNTPQLNLTVASEVVVRGCTIQGDPEKNMVGGIVVANLLGYDGTYNTRIEGCTITDCRFGLATYLRQNAYICNNTLLNNCNETNPMNGGSGINVYDPTYQQYTYIEGNHIEGSLWGITLVGGLEANIGRIDVDADSPQYNPGGNTFVNNGNGGQLYDLYNNSTNTVYAQGNTWNVAEQTEEMIENVVFHKADNQALGQVVYWPAAIPAGIDPVDGRRTGGNAVYSLSGLRFTDGQQRHGVFVENGRKIVR